MNLTSSLASLWTNDPITVVVCVFAVVALAFAGVIRKSGIDSGFIIQLFGGFATIGTLAKCVIWGLEQAVGASTSSYRPSGTDLVLLAGLVVAALWSNTESLLTLLSGDPTQSSRWERFRYWLGTRGFGPPVSWLALSPPLVDEDPNAASKRKAEAQVEDMAEGER